MYHCTVYQVQYGTNTEELGVQYYSMCAPVAKTSLFKPWSSKKKKNIDAITGKVDFCGSTSQTV